MKTMMVMAIVLLSGLRFALAQPAAQAVARPESAPTASSSADSTGFVAIDRIDGNSRGGIELAYVAFKGGAFLGDDVRALHIEGHARYVDQSTGLGGYIQLPFAYAQDMHGDRSDSITDVGDLEVGGIFVPRLGVPDFGLVLHAGVTLPTGEHGSNESGFGGLANVATLRDLYNSLPGATTLKLGASPLFHRGIVFARLDLGFDWNIDEDQQRFRNPVGKAIHFNAGVGVDLGRAVMMLESENVAILDQRDSMGNTIRGATLNELAVSTRVNAGAVSPYAAVVIPLDHDLDSVDAGFLGGVEFKF